MQQFLDWLSSGSSERQLRVVLLDVNEHAPQLAPASATLHVAENLPPGAPVGLLAATDADSAPDDSPAGGVLFELLSSAAAHANVTNDSSFSLWRLQSDGRLFALESLDRELVAAYKLRVRLVDAGGLNSIATVLVTVDDVDDNAPQFLNHRFTSIDELNASIRFARLMYSTHSKVFLMFCYRSYSFTVLEDDTPSELMQTGRVDSAALALRNRLTKHPEASCRGAFGSEPHSSFGTRIGRVSAIDRDSDDNARIRCAICTILYMNPYNLCSFFCGPRCPKGETEVYYSTVRVCDAYNTYKCAVITCLLRRMRGRRAS